MLLKSMKFWGSTGNLSKIKDSTPVHSKYTFSTLVGSGGSIVQRSAAQRKIQALKQTRQANANVNDFKIGEVDETIRTVRSIEGVRQESGSEVLYVGSFTNDPKDKRGRIVDVFDAYESNLEGAPREGISRCLSQPDFFATGAIIGSDTISEDVMNQRPSGIFERPGLGSLSIP